MKIVNMAALIVLAALAINCGDKPPQDPSSSGVDQDAAAPVSTDAPPASTSSN